jgi:hypothetical protein
MDLVRNIKKTYEAGDGHVHVLAASIRNLNHLLGSIALQAELATAPATEWEEWAAASLPMPGRNNRSRRREQFKFQHLVAKTKLFDCCLRHESSRRRASDRAGMD